MRSGQRHVFIHPCKGEDGSCPDTLIYIYRHIYIYIDTTWMLIPMRISQSSNENLHGSYAVDKEQLSEPSDLLCDKLQAYPSRSRAKPWQKVDTIRNPKTVPRSKRHRAPTRHAPKTFHRQPLRTRTDKTQGQLPNTPSSRQTQEIPK